ncbi:hypothetical protein [Arthrobacter humicola]
MTAIERPRYTQGQTLGAADFRAEQAYHRNGRRRHLLGPHTWGITLGLDLVEQPNPIDPTLVDVMLRPGLATDGYGRELMVDSALRLDPAAFSAFADIAHRQVYLAYDEVTSGHDNARYDDCLPGHQTRITEGYRIVVDPTPPTHDTVDIAGQPGVDVPAGGSLPAGAVAIPDDESIPYQTLPDGVTQRWLIRLGDVKWDGTTGRFRPADPGALTSGRRYAGLVADHLLGANGTLRIAPRDDPDDATPPAPDVADFATVEGRLRVQGRINAEKDIYLEASAIRYVNTPPTPTPVAMAISRAKPVTGTGEQLRLQLGTDPDDTHRLVVGRDSGSSAVDLFGVSAAGHAYLPSGIMSFGAQTRQMIDLWGGGHEYGIGVQDHTLYQRSGSDFAWFRGGTHSNARGDAGGGSVAMTLTHPDGLRVNAPVAATGRLTVGAGGDDQVRTRHVVGKQSGNDNIDHLYLNFQTGRDVVVGNMTGITSSLQVSGDLRVLGTIRSVLEIWTTTVRVKNAGSATPRSWSVTIPPGVFTSITSAFAVLQGFSLFNNEGSSAFDQFGHVANVDAIPQHVMVMVDGVAGLTQVFGRCFCAESSTGAQDDNTVLFTVVVIGRRTS